MVVGRYDAVLHLRGEGVRFDLDDEAGLEHGAEDPLFVVPEPFRFPQFVNGHRAAEARFFRAEKRLSLAAEARQQAPGSLDGRSRLQRQRRRDLLRFGGQLRGAFARHEMSLH